MGWLADQWEDLQDFVTDDAAPIIGAGAGLVLSGGNPLGALAGYGVGSSMQASERTADTAEEQAAATLQTEKSARQLNIERYGEAKDLMSPYIEQAGTAREQMMVEMGLAPGESGAYMQTPGYEALLDERQRGVEQSMAGGGSLYSGRRIKAAADVGGATQNQFYTNYMSMLQNMGSPAVATNLASLGTGQAATMGQQQMQAQQTASGYMMGGAQARQAAVGDVAGMGANIYGGYLAGGGGGSGGGGGGYTTDYSIPMTSTDYPGYI